jgi:hypothetical protein
MSGEKTPVSKSPARSKPQTTLPPKGSAAYKALVLQGKIKE